MMQNNPMMDFALNLIQQNPALQKNPNAKEMIEVIRSGDTAKGEQIASNLCKTYGIDKNQAVQQARSFFNI